MLTLEPNWASFTGSLPALRDAPKTRPRPPAICPRGAILDTRERPCFRGAAGSVFCCSQVPANRRRESTSPGPPSPPHLHSCRRAPPVRERPPGPHDRGRQSPRSATRSTSAAPRDTRAPRSARSASAPPWRSQPKNRRPKAAASGVGMRWSPRGTCASTRAPRSIRSIRCFWPSAVAPATSRAVRRSRGVNRGKPRATGWFPPKPNSGAPSRASSDTSSAARSSTRPAARSRYFFETTRCLPGSRCIPLRTRPRATLWSRPVRQSRGPTSSSPRAEAGY
jgi:hypothetical protein